MRSMASFRNSFKIFSNAAVKFPYVHSEVLVNNGRGSGKEMVCFWEIPRRKISNWQPNRNDRERETGVEVVEKGSENNSMNLLVNDPNSSMWQLYRESYSTTKVDSTPVGGKKAEASGAGRNVHEYYKVRWESENGAKQGRLANEETEVAIARSQLRLSEVQKPPRETRQLKRSFFPASLSKRRPSIEVMDEPLAGKIVGEQQPIEEQEACRSFWSKALPQPDEAAEKEDPIGTTADKGITKSPLLSFKCEPTSYVKKNFFDRSYSTYSQKTRAEKPNVFLFQEHLRPAHTVFNPRVVRQFMNKLGGYQWPNNSESFLPTSFKNFSTNTSSNKKASDCEPPKEKLTCVKKNPPVPECHVPVNVIKWPECEKMCLPCCPPAQAPDCHSNYVKGKTCKKVEYRHPSFSECRRDRLASLKEKECCYEKKPCPEHAVEIKSPFTTVKQRTEKILGHESSRDPCAKSFSTYSFHNSHKKDSGCEPPKEKLTCVKKNPPVPECHVPVNIIKWPECQKVCLPCCPPAQAPDCESNYVKGKTCKKVEYRHPSFSECKREKLASRKMKECCYSIKNPCPEHAVEIKSPFTTVKQRTDKILGREPPRDCD